FRRFAVSPFARLCCRKRGGTFTTELGPWQILKSTARAAVLESTATLDTKLGPLGILRAAACAAHGASLLHDLEGYQLNFARSPSSAFTYPIGALEKSQACTFLGTILVIVRPRLSLKIWLSWMSGRDNISPQRASRVKPSTPSRSERP